MSIVTQLKRDEGFRNRIYQDQFGIPTIGCGRNLRDVGLSDDEVNFLLSNDVKRVSDALSQFAWFQSLDEVRQGVFVNMAFNMGVQGLLHFPHMLAAAALKDWEGVASEMHASKWFVQVGERAARLQKQIITGVWQ